MMMLLRCPYCGKTMDLLPLPKENAEITCDNPECGKLFTVEQGAAPSPDVHPRADSRGKNNPEVSRSNQASPSENGAASPPPENESQQSIANSLAQGYFSDISEEDFAANLSEKKPSESENAKVAELQRQQLLQLAREAAEESKAEQPLVQHEKQQLVVRKIREKGSQGVWFWIFMLILFLIPIGRIFATRMRASLDQFTLMQPQIIPSLLYFAAAVILLCRLLRRTAKPQWFFAVLLFLPLLMDYWYLFPESLNYLHPDMWKSAGGAIKILVSVFALFSSFRARRHPALRFKEADI